MNNRLKSRLLKLEKHIDSVLLSHEIFQCDPFQCVELAGGIVEEAWLSHVYEWFGGLEILVPMLLMNKSSSHKQPTIGEVVAALNLAQDYYHLRDYFYYTYNLPKAINWRFVAKNYVRIEINDASLPLQLFLELNNTLLGSQELFSNYTLGRKIEGLVNSIEDEFSPSPQLSKAYALCMKEAKLKLENHLYHSFLPHKIVFDSYSIDQFWKVYTHVVARCLLRRYFLEERAKKGSSGFPNYIRPSRRDFVESLMEATRLDENTLTAVLNDITLDDYKMTRHQSISSFPLIYNPKGDFYYLFPNVICFSNCFNSLRKLWAIRNPSKYGECIAPHVNANFVRYMSRLLAASGFKCVLRGVKLKKKGFASLPDIDILAFWKEHGFGYVVFACELKSTIPETFGKDYVSSVGPKGYLTKAVTQINRIHGFLGGREFADLVKKYLPEDLFEYGLYALNFLVVTSHNVGVFVAADEVKIIDHETFRHILRSSKGDILRVLKALNRKEFERICGDCYKIIRKESSFGDLQISIPMVGLSKFLVFNQLSTKPP